MEKYKTFIGLEIHVQLKTKSKMFCRCDANYREDAPNSHCCPICLGLPGALPFPNQKAIESVLKMGLALNCQINEYSHFSRKNYFYPDLPKGYQITQYDKPFCHDGKFNFNSHEIGITRIHLEEDTAKSIHTGQETLLDFNKSGIPLMELVTEPDFHDAETVFTFAKKIRQLVRYLEISDGDMEKGMLRIEPNISIKKKDEKGLPLYKVEIKNLNSFSALFKAVQYEIDRQKAIIENHKIPIQETRGWDDLKRETFSQRSKEEAHDYLYFPEPDIPPIHIVKSKKENGNIILEDLKRKLPELPEAKIYRFQKDYQLTLYDAEILCEEKELAAYFEKAAEGNSHLGKKIANWIITEILSNLNENFSLKDLKIKPSQIVEIISLIEKNEISQTSGKEILKALILKVGEVSEYIKKHHFEKVSDSTILDKVSDKIISENPKPVSDYKSGKVNALQFLIGQVMKETKGTADIKKVREILETKLKNK